MSTGCKSDSRYAWSGTRFQHGRHLVVRVPRMSSRSDVYIVGLGIHPFGRHEGVTGLDMGVIAVKSALGDAHLTWDKIDFAVGGSNTAKPDALVGRLGLPASPSPRCAMGVQPVALRCRQPPTRCARVWETWPSSSGSTIRAGRVQQRRRVVRPRFVVPAVGPDGDDAVFRDAHPSLHVRARGQERNLAQVAAAASRAARRIRRRGGAES